MKEFISFIASVFFRSYKPLIQTIRLFNPAMTKIVNSCVLFPILSLLSSCNSIRNQQEQENYIRELKEWKSGRIERLKSKTGWLNLAGLYWLNEGDNQFGSDSSNKIIFPAIAPAFCGNIRLKNDSVFFTADPIQSINVNGNPVSEMSLKNDMEVSPTVMETGSLAWMIIKRDTQYGIRLRDYKHPRVHELDSIPSYPVEMKWRITADFIPFDTIRKIEVGTVTGGTESDDCPGILTFKINRKKYTLFPFREGDEFFIIFADKTSGKDTYGTGRFMYTNGPDSKNKVIIDFNKAYNPPCAFSSFATCPMPPRENILDVEVTAGEKVVHLE